MSTLIVASEALARGELTRKELDRRFDRVYRNVYWPRGAHLTASDRVYAAWLSTGRQATMAGMSAAVLHASKWVPEDAAPEILATHHRAPAGIVGHAAAVRADEVCQRNGIRCTTAARTGFDIGRRLAGDEAIIRIDALLNATGRSVAEISDIAARYPGARHIRRLRRALDLVDGGAESPQETRVRLILVRGGIQPRPTTQIHVGRRRVDMGWPQWKVGVEYDGIQHWQTPEQHRDDIARLEFLAAQGWRIVRVVAEHLRHPDRIVARVQTALRAAGWRP